MPPYKRLGEKGHRGLCSTVSRSLHCSGWQLQITFVVSIYIENSIINTKRTEIKSSTFELKQGLSIHAKEQEKTLKCIWKHCIFKKNCSVPWYTLKVFYGKGWQIMGVLIYLLSSTLYVLGTHICNPTSRQVFLLIFDFCSKGQEICLLYMCIQGRNVYLFWITWTARDWHQWQWVFYLSYISRCKFPH